jgi:hypothetical protein
MFDISPDIGMEEPDIPGDMGAEAVLPDIPGVIGIGVLGAEAFGSVVGVEGVLAACAKAPGAAAASMAATALASANLCKVIRVGMGGKAPFYKNRSEVRSCGLD